MTPLRVLHVVQPTEAGVPRVLLEYARQQQDSGFTVAIASPADDDFTAEFTPSGITHLPWKAHRSPVRGVLSETRRLRKLSRSWRPDVVHLHSSKAGLIGRLVFRGRTRTIFQPHAWSFQAAVGLVATLSMLWERFAQRWTHATVCVSHDELDEGRRRKILTSGFVFPNRVDPSQWTPLDRTATRQELGISATDPTAVCVGRVCEQKGQDILLDIWPMVRSVVPQATLICVGDGPDLETWSGRRVEGVRFVGADHPLRWYSAADAVLAPSRWEGMALVPLEATCVGRPVVAHDVAGMKQALHDTGTFIDPSDRSAFADAVIGLLSDTTAADALGSRARVEALERWVADKDQPTVSSLYCTQQPGRRPHTQTLPEASAGEAPPAA